jgi:hypothetical protein
MLVARRSQICSFMYHKMYIFGPNAAFRGHNYAQDGSNLPYYPIVSL